MKGVIMSKKVKRLNKEYYVTDEYGHTDAIMVRKVNELIDIINYQAQVIRDFELMMKGGKRNNSCYI